MKGDIANTGSNTLGLIIDGATHQISVDSRVIAKEFEREHKSVLRTLDDLIADGTVSQHEFVPRNYQKRGKEYRCFELNKAGCLKAMPFIGGRKSREGQKRLVDEFLRLENQLNRQAKERETLAYQVARLSGKDSRGILTDAIQQFADYAREQGSQNADRYFANITQAIYKALLIIEPQATEIRELLTAVQLKTLELAELTAAQTLTEGMESQQPYKAIYQAVKAALDGIVGAKVKVLGG
ncbi:Rha family transcriptional regulator [Methylomonas montana]|uniref:Rha family transcriptional regulator n=1 Tax=Methylomonas montana TaxID=3058963 RepID=UPI0026585475|nr:Rha family transcriptional regulator [Methylomonas montana]WKJ90314.1 Rha family transcriptional regulator [Methylomonas montana]